MPKKQTKQISLILAGLLLSCCRLIVAAPVYTYKPPGGYVPDAKTAIRIATAVWAPIYGEKQIQSEKPFHAVLKQGVWTVTGSLPSRFSVGGVALAEIAKQDGRILRVIHGR